MKNNWIVFSLCKLFRDIQKQCSFLPRASVLQWTGYSVKAQTHPERFFIAQNVHYTANWTEITELISRNLNNGNKNEKKKKNPKIFQSVLQSFFLIKKRKFRLNFDASREEEENGKPNRKKRKWWEEKRTCWRKRGERRREEWETQELSRWLRREGLGGLRDRRGGDLWAPPPGHRRSPFPADRKQQSVME